MITIADSKTMIKILLLAISVGVAWSVSAGTLWGSTEYGMTPSQVTALLPEVVEPPIKPSYGNGVNCLLRQNDIQIVGSIFHASFCFSDNKLEQVTLEMDHEDTFSSQMIVFNSLTEALRTKYGAEVTHRVDPSFLANSLWVSGRTNVRLLMIAVGTNLWHLQINYNEKSSQEADKL